MASKADRASTDELSNKDLTSGRSKYNKTNGTSTRRGIVHTRNNTQDKDGYGDNQGFDRWYRQDSNKRAESKGLAIKKSGHKQNTQVNQILRSSTSRRILWV